MLRIIKNALYTLIVATTLSQTATAQSKTEHKMMMDRALNQLRQGQLEQCVTKRQEHSYVYYLSGIFTDKEGAEKNFEALEDKFTSSVGRIEFELSHNPTHGLKDLVEVYEQKTAEKSFEKFWSILMGAPGTPSWYTAGMLTMRNSGDKISYANDLVLRDLVAHYIWKLKSGKKVVIVSHSQGNFYANSAYDYISKKYPQYKNSIGIVAVGSPASSVKGGGHYFNNKKDLVLNLVDSVYKVVPRNFSYDQPRNVLNHDFVKTYLQARGNPIKSAVSSTINRLSTPTIHADCQDALEISTLDPSQILAKSAVGRIKVLDGEASHLWMTISKHRNINCGSTIKGSVINAIKGKTFNIELNKLDHSTTYHIRACGYDKNRKQIVSGDVKSFRTQAAASLSLRSLTTIGITHNSAIGRLYVSNGEAAYIWMKISTSSSVSCGNTVNPERGKASKGETHDFVFKNLTVNKRYYVRACGYDSNYRKIVHGTSTFFNTSSPEVVITKQVVGDITQTTAIISSRVTKGNVKKKWFVYGLSSSLSVSCDSKTRVGEKTGNYQAVHTFSTKLVGLKPGTQYKFKACASNSEGDIFAPDIITSFNTSPFPTVRCDRSYSHDEIGNVNQFILDLRPNRPNQTGTVNIKMYRFQVTQSLEIYSYPSRQFLYRSGFYTGNIQTNFYVDGTFSKVLMKVLPDTPNPIWRIEKSCIE